MNKDAVSRALASLMGCGAQDGSIDESKVMSVTGDDPQLPTLQELEQLGVTRCVDLGHLTSSWRVTCDGQTMIQSAIEIIEAEPASRPRPDVLVKNMTQWELIALLRDREWKLNVWWDTKTKPAPINVATGKPKTLWARPWYSYISRNYLLACARLDEVKLDWLDHFRTEAYYKRALKPVTMKITCDMGADVGLETDAKKKRNRERKVGVGVGVPRDKKTDTRDKVKKRKAGATSALSYEWGAGMIALQEKKNSWQATCSRCYGGHKNRARPSTLCRRNLVFKSDAESLEVQRHLKYWLNSAYACADRVAHIKFQVKGEAIPSDEKLTEAIIPPCNQSGSDEDNAKPKKRRLVKSHFKTGEPAERPIDKEGDEDDLELEKDLETMLSDYPLAVAKKVVGPKVAPKLVEADLQHTSSSSSSSSSSHASGRSSNDGSASSDSSSSDSD